MTIVNYQDVLDFWFDPDNAESLFAKDDAFDDAIRSRFGETWEAACVGLLWDWRQNAFGRLAEIIVLDQFSRNLCRGDARCFAQDGMSLVLAQELYSMPEFSKLLSPDQQAFAAMPFMHSESSEVHRVSLRIFQEIGMENSLHFEVIHKDIIDRFGRYPHRNEVLGRLTTAEEAEFLKGPDSSF